MPSKACGRLEFSPALTQRSQQDFVLDNHKTGTLISLGRLCGDKCITLFTKYGVKIIKNHHEIITGKREENRLWTIPLHPVPPQPVPSLQANGIVHLGLVLAQDGPFLYTRSHLSAHQNCALLLSTNFPFIFIFKNSLHNLVI